MNSVKIFKDKNSAGFSLLELIIVIGIIIFLSAIILPNYRAASFRFVLERSAYKLTQDIRRTAEMAISANERPGTAEVPPGYGIYFDINTDTGDKTRYKIYADIDSNEYFTPPPQGTDIVVEEITLEKGAIIQSVSPLSKTVSINFKPPAPTVKIKDSAGNEFNSITITLSLESDSTRTRIIEINKAGLVDVQ